MSIKASSGEWKLKKKRDHQKLRNNCIAKNNEACNTNVFDALLFQTSQSEMAISKYKIVQTGPKRYPGGFQEGLTSVVNQSLSCDTEKNPESSPTD